MHGLLAIVLPLALDTFAVALTLGASRLSRRDRVRVALILAAFEGAMPLVGLALGGLAGRVAGRFAEPAAGLVLIAVGLAMLLERRARSSQAEASAARPSTVALAVVGLGLAISFDELAIGFTLGLIDVDVRSAVAALTVQAFVVAQLGLALGARIGAVWGDRAERLAGIALAGYGASLLITTL